MQIFGIYGGRAPYICISGRDVVGDDCGDGGVCGERRERTARNNKKPYNSKRTKKKS